MELPELDRAIDLKVVEELNHISRILDPVYRLIKPIGNGGMGNVYLASAPHLSAEPIAIKILHPEYALDENLLKRFLREAELLQKVDHPNVIKVYEANSISGLTFYAMEYAHGKTLEDLLKIDLYPVSKIAEFIVAIASALNAIHQKGIIHRDLKPANIVLSEDFSPKLMDFGIARPENSQLTHHNEIVGSVCYIPPEIWIGEEPTSSVDLYSLGVVLYEMMTGMVPFDGTSPGELMRKHLQATPIPPKDIQAGMPSYINRLILRLLSKQKQDRPRDAMELIGIVEKNVSVSTDTKKFRAYRHDTEEFLRVVNTKSEATIQKMERTLPREAEPKPIILKPRKPTDALPTGNQQDSKEKMLMITALVVMSLCALISMYLIL